MTDNIVVLGPWSAGGTEEWMVTRYDDSEEDSIQVRVDGESVFYPLSSESVTLREDATGKAQTLIEKFRESNYLKTMEVEFARSGSIRVSGV
jgi:hypothetical protein